MVVTSISSQVCRVEVLNDFEAVGYGVPELRDNDIITLHDVPAHPKVIYKPS